MARLMCWKLNLVFADASSSAAFRIVKRAAMFGLKFFGFSALIG
jgi:hypothetical protein